MKSSLTTCK